MAEQLWSAYDHMGADFERHAEASMRDRYPGEYDRLTTEPGFLILRLTKPPVPPLTS